MTLSTSLKRYFSNGSHKSSTDIPSATGPAISTSSSALSKNDPLYEPDKSETASVPSPPPSASTASPAANSAAGSTSFSALNKPLPNDLQRQQRNQQGKKLPSNMNKLSVVSSSSSSSSAPAPASKNACTSPLNKSLTGGIGMHSNCSTSGNINMASPNVNLSPSFSFNKPFGGPSSPVDIFERNVQNADLSTDLSNSPLANNSNFSTSTNNSTLNVDLPSSGPRPHSQPQAQLPSRSGSRSHSRSQSFTNLNNSYILSNCRPRHLLSENYTSPVLDSTVELISSQKFDDTDVVEVPHARTSEQLFKSHSHVSNASFSGSSSPRLSISRKYSNPANNGPAKTQINLEHLQTSFSHNRSRSSFSNVSSPLLKTKSESHCTCSNNHNNATSNNPLNADSPLVSPQRKSISFYSYLDLLNYERLSSGNNKNYASSSSPSPPTYNNDFLKRQSDLYNAQEEAEDLRDLNNAQLLENQLTGDLLSINCPKHGIAARRMAHQGCMEDGDARIDEELNINKPKSSKGTSANNAETKHSGRGTPLYSVFSSHSAIADDHNQTQEEEEEEEEQDGSIQSWVPEDNNLNSENSRTGSRRQSIVEEMASLKSCTTNNSYFEDELEECSTHDTGSRIGVPVVNVCSANDYLSSRTRELRNSFVCNDPTLTPKKIFQQQ